MAGLTQSVEHLKDAIKDQRDDLRTVQKILWTATGALLVVATVGGFLINKMWDTLVELAELVRHLPTRQSSNRTISSTNPDD